MSDDTKSEGEGIDRLVAVIDRMEQRDIEREAEAERRIAELAKTVGRERQLLVRLKAEVEHYQEKCGA